MMSILTDEHFMLQAIRLAEQAFEEDEVPIGALVVANDLILGKGYNQTERLHDPTAHAEMLALTAAADALGSRVLADCTLYVTVEPCPMCAGAIRLAQLGRLVYATPEPKTGFSRHQPSILHPRTQVQHGIMADEAADLMKRFFARKR